MNNKKFPWELLIWSIIGAVVLRPICPDNTDYMGCCLIYAVILGLVASVIEVRDED